MKYSIYLLLLVFGFFFNTPLHSKNTKIPIKSAFSVDLGKEFNVSHIEYSSINHSYFIAPPKDEIGFEEIECFLVPDTKIVYLIVARKHSSVTWDPIYLLLKALKGKYGEYEISKVNNWLNTGWDKKSYSWWDKKSSSTIAISFENRGSGVTKEYRFLSVSYRHSDWASKAFQAQDLIQQNKTKERIESFKNNL